MEEILNKYMEPIFEYGPDFDLIEMQKIMPEIQIQLFAVFYFSSSLMRGGPESYFIEHHSDNLHEHLIKGLKLLNESMIIEYFNKAIEIMNDKSIIDKWEMFDVLKPIFKKHLEGYTLYEKVRNYVMEHNSKFVAL